MMNDETVVEPAKPFIKPSFDDSSINGLKFIFDHVNFDQPLKLTSNPPELVKESWETVKKGDFVKNLILILVDSVGMHNIAENYSILGQFREHVLSLDTCFPTTTATVMTSLSHGTLPSEHGITGYNFWDQSVGELVNALNLKTIKEDEVMHVIELGFDKEHFVVGESFSDLVLRKARDEGKTLNLKLFKPDMIESDGILQFLFPRDHVIEYPALDPSSAIKTILQDLNQHVFDLQVFVFYYPHPDHASHYFGSTSSEYHQALQLMTKIVNTLTRHSSVSSGDTAVVLTSDHGQVDLPPMESSRRMVISKKEFQRFKNEGLVLGTSGRVIQAYFIDEDKGEKAFERFLKQLAFLRDHLHLLEKKDALSLFGTANPSKTIQQRIGDQIILMDEHVFIDCPPVVPYGLDLPLKADHGSLTPREVKVPFMIF